jgi:hypothetical protein
MTAQFVVGIFNGHAMAWIEMFPMTQTYEPVVEIHERYDLTPDQARLPINQLKTLVRIGTLKRKEDGDAGSLRMAGSN